mgnify:CR=1 FL=1
MDGGGEVGWYVLGPSQEHVGPYALSELRGTSSPLRHPIFSLYLLVEMRTPVARKLGLNPRKIRETSRVPFLQSGRLHIR